jgi:hypothetical protein
VLLQPLHCRARLAILHCRQGHLRNTAGTIDVNGVRSAAAATLMVTAHFGESCSALASAASCAALAKPSLLAQDFHHGSEVPLTAATGDSFDKVIMNDSGQRRGGARLVS